MKCEQKEEIDFPIPEHILQSFKDIHIKDSTEPISSN